ncbi:MAG: GMC family oxidoreductase [Zetaproteobacteria bacterium]|nr:GMC family oxidoreductase [Pseudobdellovibrionaceae bacterium]
MDVVIVGTGAGGGTCAEIMAAQGLNVLLIEEGTLQTSKDFRMLEKNAFIHLYQDLANRQSTDGAISIFQGKGVGGSTTVNWCSSFRTPDPVLKHWQQIFGLQELSSENLAPWFTMSEKRLSIVDWPMPDNGNNAVLARGAQKLGITFDKIKRNVLGCINLGYCGLGCPVNGKQSMLVTTIPESLRQGSTLIFNAKVNKVNWRNNRVESVSFSSSSNDKHQHDFKVEAKHYVLAAGSMGTPGVLLRSEAPDPYNLLGKRTFLHPVLVSSALMPEEIAAYKGAPQTIYSDHFISPLPEQQIGYKIEVSPMQPVLWSILNRGYGKEHFQRQQEFPHRQVSLALLRDGFHPESTGGQVTLHSDGTPALDYPISKYVWNGARRALKSMVEIQFAAGAKSVNPLHVQAGDYTSWKEAKHSIDQLAMQPRQTKILSAHVMGGCMMGTEEKTSVVNKDGRHHQLENLSVMDGSLFPTSLGANPQLSIFGIVSMLATRLTNELA